MRIAVWQCNSRRSLRIAAAIVIVLLLGQLVYAWMSATTWPKAVVIAGCALLALPIGFSSLRASTRIAFGVLAVAWYSNAAIFLILRNPPPVDFYARWIDILQTTLVVGGSATVLAAAWTHHAAWCLYMLVVCSLPTTFVYVLLWPIDSSMPVLHVIRGGNTPNPRYLYEVAPDSLVRQFFPDDPRAYFDYQPELVPTPSRFRRPPATDPRGCTEHSLTYAFNRLGLRSPDITIPRPAHTYRILCLGDSQTFGQGVQECDTFCRRLEARLNMSTLERSNSFTYEVVNAGRSGYSTREERAWYEEVGSALDPQLVLVVMCWNDFEFANRPQLGQPRPTRRPRKELCQACVLELAALRQSCEKNGANLAVAFLRTDAKLGDTKTMVDTVEAGLRPLAVPFRDIGNRLLAEAWPWQLHVHRVDWHPNEIAHRITADELYHFLLHERLVPLGEPVRAETTPAIDSRIDRAALHPSDRR